MATAAELAGATDEDIAEAKTALVTHVASSFPALSLTSGPLADLVLGPAADALAAVDVRATAVEASLDPEEALANGGYDEDVLAVVLAGRGVTRIAASYATGTAAIKFTDTVSRTVHTGFRFYTADGVYFKTTESVSFLAPTATVVLSGQRLLVHDTTDDTYVGTVAVTAEETGFTGNRTAGTALESDSELTGQDSALLATDTTGGADAETDAALLARLPAATAPRTTASFYGAEGAVNSVATFSSTEVIGYGDTGMRRGRSSLTGQTPGRVDVRVRVNSAPGRVRVPVTGTYLGPSGPQGSWQCPIAVDDAPGWYKVERIVLRGADMLTGGYTPTVSYGYNLSGATITPDIRSVSDAFFSRYLTATVQFQDTDTDISGLTINVSTNDYDAILRYIPGIAEAQDAVDAEDVRSAGGDCLVRAAAPVMVSVTAAATVLTGVELTDDELAEAVAEAINASIITSTLNASTVGAAAQNLLPAGTLLQLSSWTGIVHNWDGTTSSISGTSGLSVVTNWTNGLGDNTVAFYADVEDVTATVS